MIPDSKKPEYINDEWLTLAWESHEHGASETVGVDVRLVDSDCAMRWSCRINDGSEYSSWEFTPYDIAVCPPLLSDVEYSEELSKVSGVWAWKRMRYCAHKMLGQSRSVGDNWEVFEFADGNPNSHILSVAKHIWEEFGWLASYSAQLRRHISPLFAVRYLLEWEEHAVRSMRKPDPGYVYLLHAEGDASCYYKIGKSKKPEDRIENIQLLVPFNIHAEHKISALNFSYAETYLKRKYRAVNIKGEWFALSPQSVADIKAIERM